MAADREGWRQMTDEIVNVCTNVPAMELNGYIYTENGAWEIFMGEVVGVDCLVVLLLDSTPIIIIINNRSHRRELPR